MAFEKTLTGLQKTILAKTNTSGGTNPYKSQMAALNEMRTAMQGNVAAMDTYRMRQGMVLNSQDAWTKKIHEGKATFGDLIKNHKMLGSVLKDQLSLQQAVGNAWSQSTKTGKFSVDMAAAKSMSSEVNTLTNRMGLLSKITNVASGQMVNWGKNTQWAGRQLMVGFAVPMGIAAAATGKMAYDMDKALTQVVKVYGDATSTIQESTNSIRNSAMTTAESAARVYGQSAQTTLGIMADLAASGKTGNELQQATMSTTRAAILGELDWQDAVKATITMQSVYHASQTQLADNWNYINAVENQTVLSAQDFVTAIPKVAGVMNELGGTLKDTGSLLTAFKAAGIDAAEGANALKSINFRVVATYGKGLATFNQATGKDLRKIIDETNGETIPTLMKFGEAIKNLSAPQKIAVTRDVFGIYQGSKALMLIEQMTSKTDQWNQAMQVAQNTNIENAAIAQQELDRSGQQPFKKLDKAVATLQINLANVGKSFLGPAASIVEWVGKMVKGFNDMNPLIKTFAAGIALAIGVAGPILMLVGLFANLIGNVAKMGSGLSLLATRFKFLTDEERMQQIVSKQSTNIWDQQTGAAARLTAQIMELNAALATAAGLKTPAAANNPRLLQLRQDAANRLEANKQYAAAPLPAYRAQYVSTGKGAQMRDTETGRLANAQKANAANEVTRRSYDNLVRAQKTAIITSLEEQQARTALTAVTEKQAIAQEQAAIAGQAAATRLSLMSRGISTAAMATMLLTSSFAGGDGFVGWAAKAAAGVAMIGMIFPNVMAKVAISAFNGVKSIGLLNKAGTAVANGFKSIGPTMISSLKVAGPAIAAIGLLAYLAIKKFNDEIDASRQKSEDLANAAKGLSDTLGYSYTPGGSTDPSTVKDGKRATEIIADKMKETNKGVSEAFSEKQGLDIGEKWGEALAAGIDAKAHGATVEQAQSTVRAVMLMMGKSFDDAEFAVEIKAHLNFDDNDKMLEEQLAHTREVLASALSDAGANGWEEFWNGGGQLSQAGAVQVKKTADTYWSMFMNTDAGKRKEMMTKIAGSLDKDMTDAFKTISASHSDLMGELGIKNVSDFVGQLRDGLIPSAQALGMSEDEYKIMRKKANELATIAQQMGIASGQSENLAAGLHTIDDVMKSSTVADRMDEQAAAVAKVIPIISDYQNSLDEAYKKTGKLTDADFDAAHAAQDNADGIYKKAKAASYFSEVSRGAAVDAETFNKKLSELGYGSDVTLESITTSYKNIYGSVQSQMFDDAARAYDEAQKSDMDALKASGQVLIDGLDAKAKSTDAYYANEKQKQQDAQAKEKQNLQDSQDAQKAIFDKSAEAQKKRLSDAAEAEKNRFDANAEARKKALDDSATRRLDAFKNAQDAQTKSVTSYYEARTKAVDDAIKAEQDAENIRQKIFEAEKSRIQRLSEMYSNSININMAINSGNLDEAAKLASNQMSTEMQWSVDDSSSASGDSSQKRIDALNVKKDNITKEKDARLEALKTVQDAEQKAMQTRLETEKANLDKLIKNQKDALDKRLGIEKDHLDASLTAQKNALDRRLEMDKRAMEKRQNNDDRVLARQESNAKASIETDKKTQTDKNARGEATLAANQARFKRDADGQLAILRMSLPKNAKEMQTQADKISLIYNKYGGALEKKGREWTGSLVGYMRTASDTERTRLANDKGWAAIGKQIATDMMKGAFGMTPQQFAAFINGGTAPPGSVFSLQKAPGSNVYGSTSSAEHAAQYKSVSSGTQGKTLYGSGSLHTGGIVDTSMGDRAGMTGDLHPTEIVKTLLLGEGVINHKGMAAIGKEGLDHINSGGGMGGGGEVLGMGALYPAMMAGATTRMIRMTIGNLAAKRDGKIGTFLGANAGTASPASMALKAVGNAFGNANTPFSGSAHEYPTGRVVYLGHNGYYDGNAHLGAMTRPTAGRTVSEFGPRNLLGMSFHNGIDIVNSSGTPTRAAAAGKVIFKGWDNTGYGNYIEIGHPDGTMTGYGHHRRILVNAGQQVASGQQIGEMGTTGKSTGDHLHFQTGRNGNWFNPRKLFPQLDTGAMILSEGLANLHPKESVLTAPLTQKLQDGVQQFANGGGTEYHITMDFNGARFANDAEIENAVTKSLRSMEKRQGPSRRIG